MAKKKKKRKVKILNLYPEDFEKINIWQDILDVLGVEDNNGVAIVFTKVMILP